METLEGLFKWSHELALVDTDANPVIKPSTGQPWIVYQRVVGDAELQLAKENALRASAMHRRKLADISNLERLLIIPDYARLDKENLIALIILYEVPEIRQEALQHIELPFPQLTNANATLKEQEEHQLAIDGYFDERDKLLLEKSNQIMHVRKNELEKMSEERLRNIHEEAAINTACREIFATTLNEMMTYLGTYLDAEFTTRAFKSYNSFKNANSHLKLQLIKGYLDLELKGDQLKK